MSTSVTFNGTSYSIPSAAELNWQSLSAFLVDVGLHAGLSTTETQAIRTATTSPVSVSSTADRTIVTNLTTPGAIAVNLPAGTDGQIFVIVDGKGDAVTNNITITPNGAQTINGLASLVLNQNSQYVALQYAAASTSWRLVGSYYPALTNALANPMTTTGDIIVGGASGTPTRLATGAAGTVFKGGSAFAAIANTDIPTNTIALNKLATQTAGTVVIADASGIPAAQALTGAVTVSNTGVTSLGTGVVGTTNLATGAVTNATVNATAAIAGSKITPAFTATVGTLTDTTASSTTAFKVQSNASTGKSRIALGTTGGDNGYMEQDNATGGMAWGTNGVVNAMTLSLTGSLALPQAGASLRMGTSGAQSSVLLANSTGGITADPSSGFLLFGANGNNSGSTTTANGWIDAQGQWHFRNIGTTSSSANMNIDLTTGIITRSTVSSLRYKTNVKDLSQTDSEAVYEMRPVTFEAKGEIGGRTFLGFIAEEVDLVQSKIVPRMEVDGVSVPDSVEYDRITVMLVSEIKKLRARIEALEAK